MLIKVLIVFFTLLIFYQLILATLGRKKVIEGVGPQDIAKMATGGGGIEVNATIQTDIDDPKQAMILAQKNAGNIELLKEQVNELVELKPRVKELSSNIDTLNDQVQVIGQTQATQATQLVGNQPLNITGTTYDETA